MMSKPLHEVNWFYLGQTEEFEDLKNDLDAAIKASEK